MRRLPVSAMICRLGEPLNVAGMLPAWVGSRRAGKGWRRRSARLGCGAGPGSERGSG